MITKALQDGKLSCRELLEKGVFWFMKHGFYIVSHFLAAFNGSGAVDDSVPLRFGQPCKTGQNVGMLCQLHGKTNGQFAVINHHHHLVHSLLQ